MGQSQEYGNNLFYRNEINYLRVHSKAINKSQLVYVYVLNGQVQPNRNSS